MNKGILITGASSDIGYELIRTIGGDYDFIWAHYNSSLERVDKMSGEMQSGILPVQADFSDVDSTHRMIDTILDSGNIPKHLVFLAAFPIFNKRFHKCTWEEFEKCLDVSLKSEVMILQRMIRHMDGGKVVFMLSSYVLGMPPKFQSPYIVAKYAQYGLMRCLSAEYAGKGVCINAVSPGMVDTKFLKDIADPIIEQNAERNPKGRNLRVQEVVPSIKFLLSDSADAINGQNLGITWGMD